MVEDTYPFYLDPMPNLYFTRDPAAAIGHGLSINRMKESARRRESLFIDYIMRHHPRFAKHEIPIWSNRDYPFAMEGATNLSCHQKSLPLASQSGRQPKGLNGRLKRVTTAESLQKSHRHRDPEISCLHASRYRLHDGRPRQVHDSSIHPRTGWKHEHL